MEDRITKIQIKEQDKLLGQLYSQNLRYQLKNGTLPKDNELFTYMSELYQSNLKNQKQVSNFRYYMITVNTPIDILPESSDQISNLLTQCRKWVNRAFVNGYIFNIEFHTKKGGHLHSHILIDQLHQKSKSKIIEMAKSTFNKVLGIDINNIKHLHISGIPDHNVLEKYDYILGTKKPSKMTEVNLDKDWRLRIGISDFYSSEGFDFPQTPQ